MSSNILDPADHAKAARMMEYEAHLDFIHRPRHAVMCVFDRRFAPSTTTLVDVLRTHQTILPSVTLQAAALFAAPDPYLKHLSERVVRYSQHAAYIPLS